MTELRRWRWPAVAAAAVVVLAAAVALVDRLASRRQPAGGDAPPTQPDGDATEGPATATAVAEPTTEAAVAAAQRFFDRYVDPDGRVVRRDQGGDTVSEGQAYGMLAALAVDDRAAFERIWTWTTDNLERPDGLLATHWAGGQVVDDDPATDADLDAARALVLAGERWDDQGYRQQGTALAAAILERETADVAGDPVLVAGPWAVGDPAVVNPSYFSPRAFQLLASSTGEERWSAVGESSYRIVDELTAAAPSLPPDWATIDGTGAVQATGSPGGGGSPQFGYDAVRVPIRMAADCRERGHELAARSWPFLRGEFEQGGLVDVYGLDGQARGQAPHAVTLVAVAAAATGAGDDEAAARALDEAERLDRDRPTYYGSAWVALGRVILTTDLLGDCEGGA